jgi:uncharacterized membrane protein YkgB
MNPLVKFLAKLGLFKADLDYGLIRASMVVTFFIFGYAKWFAYDVPLLMPLITKGPLIFWLYPTFGPRGATWFLGTSEWTIGTLLLLGFWNKKLGMLGAIGSTGTFVCTVTILPFLPDAWEASAGGFPALTMSSGFLIKDLVLLAVSIYLLKQDGLRVLHAGEARVGANVPAMNMK